MSWFLIITFFALTPQGTIDAKITVEPARYSSESACNRRIEQLVRQAEAAKSKREPVPTFGAGCRGFELGVRA